MVNIPRAKHEEQAWIATKQKELKDYENLGVLDVIDNDDATDNIIDTERALIYPVWAGGGGGGFPPPLQNS